MNSCLGGELPMRFRSWEETLDQTRIRRRPRTVLRTPPCLVWVAFTDEGRIFNMEALSLDKQISVTGSSSQLNSKCLTSISFTAART
jgi:hypothetical protein